MPENRNRLLEWNACSDKYRDQGRLVIVSSSDSVSEVEQIKPLAVVFLDCFLYPCF